MSVDLNSYDVSMCKHCPVLHHQVMASSQCDVINFSSLERELRAAVESEQKHRRENEAKLRAVSQRVSSYQEFR